LNYESAIATEDIHESALSAELQQTAHAPPIATPVPADEIVTGNGNDSEGSRKAAHFDGVDKVSISSSDSIAGPSIPSADQSNSAELRARFARGRT
jgi:hypothetical protein